MASLDVFRSDCDRDFPSFRTLLCCYSTDFRHFILHCALMNHFQKKKIQHESALPFCSSGNSSLRPPSCTPAILTTSQKQLPALCRWGSHRHALRTRETRSPVNRARLQLIWLQPQLCAFVCSAEYRCPLRPCRSLGKWE